MPIGNLLKRGADCVVQGALLIYYFLYYLVKGRENEQQQACTGDKTPWPIPAADATAKNVCCLHGVQGKQVGQGYPPPPPPLAPRGFQPTSTWEKREATSERSWFSWLNPRNWFSSSPGDQRQKPIAPPRHIKPYGAPDGVPNGSSASGDYQAESWIGKIGSYLPSLGKKAEDAEAEPHPPISTRRILRVVATSVSSGDTVTREQRRQDDLIRELKHAIEPHYPATWSHDQQEPYRPTVTVHPSTEAFVPPPPPPSQIPVKVGQTTLKIHVEPKPFAKSEPSDVQRQAIWSPSGNDQVPQPHAATTSQVQMQRQQLRKTTTSTSTAAGSSTAYSSPSYELEDTQRPVRDIKRQWPPPSNATGVDIVKDLVFPTGSPGDLSSAILSDDNTTYNYDAYRPSSAATMSPRPAYEEKAEREYISSQQYQQKGREYEATETSAPNKYREFSQELTSKDSAGKGVEMFLRRRQRVESSMTKEEAIAPSPAQRMAPVAAPRKRVSSNELADTVVEAATRKEPQWHPPEPARYQPQIDTNLSSAQRRELERVASPAPPPPSWRDHERHERFFSPTPFTPGSAPTRDRLFTPPPRSHEPKVQQQAHRSVSVLGDRMEQKEFIDWSKGPEMTTTIVAATSPGATRTLKTSTYVASRGSHYTKTSTINALPRTWKSYSEAYGQR